MTGRLLILCLFLYSILCMGVGFSIGVKELIKERIERFKIDCGKPESLENDKGT